MQPIKVKNNLMSNGEVFMLLISTQTLMYAEAYTMKYTRTNNNGTCPGIYNAANIIAFFFENTTSETF